MAGRPCPLCGALSPRAMLERDSFAVLECSECGLRYLDPQPAPHQLQELYGEAYFARARAGEPGYDRYLEEIQHIRQTFRNRLELLPRPESSAKLLDVGAAIGLFVEQAREAGWTAEGVEPSAWAARYAREVLHQPVRTGTLEDSPCADGSVDGVTLWEVIEHLPDPQSTLGAVGRALKPGGWLALSTPDAGSAVARLLGRRWPGWSKVPEHLFFFDKRTLGRLLAGAGFRVESMRHVSLVVSRGYLLDRIGGIVGMNPRRVLPDSWLERAVTVNPLYDLMIVARKL